MHSCEMVVMIENFGISQFDLISKMYIINKMLHVSYDDTIYSGHVCDKLRYAISNSDILKIRIMCNNDISVIFRPKNIFENDFAIILGKLHHEQYDLDCTYHDQIF